MLVNHRVSRDERSDQTIMMTNPCDKARSLSVLAESRAYTDALFGLLRSDAFYERPVPERHRLIFYLGHLEAFDWNLISRELTLPPCHADLDHLFAFGIDPAPGRMADDVPSDWPSVMQVTQYNAHVRASVDRVVDDVSETIVDVALEHRLMHAETLSYLFHNLPLESKLVRPLRRAGAGPPPIDRMIDIAEGQATLGQCSEVRDSHRAYGWDNEFSEHTVFVPAFAISRHKITNGAYLEFVREGGPPPYFWRRRGDQWFWRTMAGDVSLPLDWPVYATHEHAQAYANWAGRSLPSEAQFHRAAFGMPGGGERRYPWGDAPPDRSYGNFDFQRWDPISVTASPGGDSAFDVSQLVGNGWEWTSTIFHPFPGFESFSFYPNYSAPFFDGCHYILKGGSSRTAARLLRRSFRNWFRPGYPYVYAGFRCVDN